jgi:hypothetical protein
VSEGIAILVFQMKKPNLFVVGSFGDVHRSSLLGIAG